MPLFKAGKDMNSYLIQVNKYYSSIPINLKKFCNQFLDDLDYNMFVTKFSQSESKNKHRHALFQNLLKILLTTTMTWPDDNIPDMKVNDLPEEDKWMVIDYVGFLIGLPQGQGNDSLIFIYQKYKHIL